METRKIKPDKRHGGWQRGCTTETVYPGLSIDNTDSGIGAIGRIERSYSLPGFVAPMHSHRDDEILSYVRSGTLLHLDSMGHEEKITPEKVLVMNAGVTFQHEERTLGRDPVEAYHVYFRPEKDGLEPMVQFREVGAPRSDEWRLLAARGDAPLFLRTHAWVHDADLHVGTYPFPLYSQTSIARVLLVFEGQVRIGAQLFRKGDIATLSEATRTVQIVAAAKLLLIATDTRARCFPGGLSSGNLMGHEG
jgi:quercetin 2,3-dioxygenase